MPEEPSILDYLKSKLKFWERGGKIEIPAETEPPEESSRKISKAVEIEPVGPEWEQVSEAKPTLVKSTQPNRWPWRSILALLLALLGQRSWEPVSDRTAGIGLIFYALGLVLLVWAYFSHEWVLSPVLETGSGSDTNQVRRLPLLLGILFALAAFITLGHNLFTIWNVMLWVFAIISFVLAFWLPEKDTTPYWRRVRSFLTRDTWQIKVSRWTLIVLVVVAVIAFFRIYNVAGVPSEPVSDHAEKILDVFDVSQGQTHIFFPRNTGREAIQMYLTLIVSWIFGTGLSYLSLKIGTVICGMATLPYLYFLGKEFGNKRIGLLAVFFAGIAYWPNVISRVGLRFPLYPLFVAPTLYYLIRGLRRRSRNDFILSGLFLGFGLHGYTPMRIVPFVVVIAVGLYLLHSQSKGSRKQAVAWLVILAIISFVVFLPLARYWLENPDAFSTRALSRLGPSERPIPGPVMQVFFSNTWNALRMFNWNDGDTWVHSIVFRPALDVVSGALFMLGIVLVLFRYIRQRHWQDLFLLLAIPLLELPSILSLAFPDENPVLTRTGAALLPVFLIVAMALDGLLTGIVSRMNRRSGAALAWLIVLFLAVFSSFQNYDLVFHQYADQYTASANDTSDMGAVITQFRQVYRTTDSVWIVAFPYWVDTRLPGVWAGIPNRDFAIWPADFNKTLDVNGTKLFMIKTDDTQDADLLKQLYPQGVLSTFHSATNLEDKNFLIFFVPSNE
jgi:4-amino-4-deoxy-L-arabinose transferase-like glycosyltransferase